MDNIMKNATFARTLDNPEPFDHPPDGVEIISTIPNNGLYQSLDELSELEKDFNTLKTKSTNFLANYSDYVTRGSLNQPWLKSRFIEVSKSNIAKNLNSVTFIGNIAFVYLNSNDPELKAMAGDLIDTWRKTKNNTKKKVIIYILVGLSLWLIWLKLK